MDMLDSYKIDLKGMRTDVDVREYVVDDKFFAALECADIHDGRLDVTLEVKKTAGAYRLAFRIDGYVCVPCDRCLNDMKQPISTEREMRVKLGDEYDDDGELVTVPYEVGVVDIAWNLYEFIALEIPLSHYHNDGECDEAMMNALDVYRTDVRMEDADGAEIGGTQYDDEAQEIDPRWSELKKILDNH